MQVLKTSLGIGNLIFNTEHLIDLHHGKKDHNSTVYFFKDALFFSNGRHIIVTRSDGTMITILKNAMGSKHFNKATTIWIR